MLFAGSCQRADEGNLGLICTSNICFKRSRTEVQTNGTSKDRYPQSNRLPRLKKQTSCSDGVVRQWLEGTESRYGSGCHLPAPGPTRLASCRSHARHIIGMLWYMKQRATRSVEGGLSLPGRRARRPNSQQLHNGQDGHWSGTLLSSLLARGGLVQEGREIDSGDRLGRPCSITCSADGTVARFDRDGREHDPPCRSRLC